jgi:hypothetical protein
MLAFRATAASINNAPTRPGKPAGTALRAGRPMSHKHESLLRAIFSDPVSHNIHWREVESLLKHLGVTIESSAGARVHVKLNRADSYLHRPHHGSTLDRNAIVHLREFLARAGATPSQYEAGRAERSGD